ncbi:hypothetical protein B5F97_04070 [Bacteroides clarus]|uniref:Uncharacterized protein n=1 Tax=Bacteroides clarus TaxID=626929 RepID=A0A1Y3YYA2_9BACE|nr:hypothetical protein B5F97_04070 [Bacteroides clarus]
MKYQPLVFKVPWFGTRPTNRWYGSYHCLVFELPTVGICIFPRSGGILQGRCRYMEITLWEIRRFFSSVCLLNNDKKCTFRSRKQSSKKKG